MSDQWDVGGWDGWMDGYTTVDGYMPYGYIYIYKYKNILFNCLQAHNGNCFFLAFLLGLFFSTTGIIPGNVRRLRWW